MIANTMKWRALPMDEGLAVQAELEALHRRYGSDTEVAKWLGCTQQLVHRARVKGRPGPVVAMGLYAFLGVSREVLLAKHRELRPKVELPEAPPEEIKLDLPHDKFHARVIAARRALISKQWDITPSAVHYVCMAPEWQSSRFDTRDAVFWIEQMKLQTLEEARAKPATEEERIFQQALRSLNAKRAKTKKQGKKPATESAPTVATRRRKAAG
jgi:hypothetical protein